MGQATLRSLERNFPDEPEKPAPADFKTALPLKHSSPVKTTRLTQESTADESPKKLQKDNSDSEQSTSSESSIKEEAEIEPAGSSGEDVSGGDRIKVDDAPVGTSPTPGTPLQSGDSESSEEEDDWEGVISDSTHAAESSDEDKPAAASTSRDSQGMAPLSLTLLLVKHSEKIRHSKCQADAHRLDTHLKEFPGKSRRARQGRVGQAGNCEVRQEAQRPAWRSPRIHEGVQGFRAPSQLCLWAVPLLRNGH